MTQPENDSTIGKLYTINIRIIINNYTKVVHYLIVPYARPYIAYGAGLNGLFHVLFGLYTDAAGIRHRKQKQSEDN